MKVLFVCLGNICRSPTAHAVFRQMAADAGLKVTVESAGTSASHKGDLPDPRSVKAAPAYSFKGLRSRPVMDQDFADYDLILAMDNQNVADLKRRCPDQFQHKIKLLLSYHPDFARFQEVPDPYYGGLRGFDVVLNLIETACSGLVAALKRPA